MLPQCSHITRKRGIYYYRRRLPGHRNGEVALSLRTRFFREAQWLAARMDIEFGRIIESVKDNTKTPDIPRIAREYLKSKLEQDMDERAASPHIGVCGRSAEPGRIVADDLEWIDGELETARTGLRERLYEHQRPLIDWVMEHNAISQELRGAVAHAIFQANVAFWETVRERTLGNFSNGHRILDEVHAVPAQAASPAIIGPRFSEVHPTCRRFVTASISRSRVVTRRV
jgi:hypothetical protein